MHKNRSGASFCCVIHFYCHIGKVKGNNGATEFLGHLVGLVVLISSSLQFGFVSCFIVHLYFEKHFVTLF